MEFDVFRQREMFPALTVPHKGRSPVYFDGPAGSQVPRQVARAVSDYLLTCNANCHGAFATSRQSDQLLGSAHRSMADFLGADDPETVAFGPNMTTLTFSLSRALARTWKAGDEVIVTALDHDANVTPWVLAARDAGATVRRVKICPEDCTLDLNDFEAKLSSKTRLVAVTCASNAVGSLTPIQRIVADAHRCGALVFLDAVHYAPHRLIDVEEWGCDFLACSAYKFFGPHVGVLWGKRQLLEELVPYKLRPAPDALPGRWMTGTQNHEGISGAAAAVDYIADLGRQSEAQSVPKFSRRDALVRAYQKIAAYECRLCEQLLDGLQSLNSVRIWGITDRRRIAERAPTVSFTHQRRSPLEVATHLDEHGIYAWDGNFYALPLTEALGLEPDGMLRIGLLHYNTEAEVARLLDALAQLE